MIPFSVISIPVIFSVAFVLKHLSIASQKEALRKLTKDFVPSDGENFLSDDGLRTSRFLIFLDKFSSFVHTVKDEIIERFLDSSMSVFVD